MIKVKLSALHRVYSKGFAFHVLAYTIIKENTIAKKPVPNQMDTWLIVRDTVEPIIRKLLEKGVLYPGEVEIWK